MKKTNRTIDATNIIFNQSQALHKLSKNIPESFDLLIDCILNLKGRVILSGIGKAGYIAHKIASSLASTGTPAFFVHPGEASHGDLGMITNDDLVIIMSNSGETRELFDMINYCVRLKINVASITTNAQSFLAKNSNFILQLPKEPESAKIAAPTTSALMMLSMGDALVTVLHEARNFTQEDFRIYHPGGKIGTNLLKISDIMRSGQAIPIVSTTDSFNDVIIVMNSKCLGCAIVVENNLLMGIITESDLQKHLKMKCDNLSAIDVMTKDTTSVNSNMLAKEVLIVMNDQKITALPVIDNKYLIGVIHIDDIIKSDVMI